MEKCDVCFGLKKYQNKPCIACNGVGEIKNHGEAINNIVSKIGTERNVYYEMYLNKYQHLIDENELLNHMQREILRIILTSEVFFIPFSINGDWDYVYTVGKVSLVQKLLDGNWFYDIMSSNLEDDVYMIEISFEDSRPITGFCCKYNNDQRDEAQGIEIYVPYSDFIKIYKKQLLPSKSEHFWGNVLREPDLPQTANAQ